MYGSTKDKEDIDMPLIKTNDSVQIDLQKSDDFDEQFLENPFGDDKGNTAFWEKVSTAYGDGTKVAWDDALNTVRVDEFIDRVKDKYKQDPMVYLIEVIYKNFIEKVKEPRLCTGFIQQMTKFGSIILRKDRDEAKKERRDPLYSLVIQTHPKKLTLLHLLAEHDLLDLAEIYLSKEFYPGVVHIESQKRPVKLPFEVALEKEHDEMASMLANVMNPIRVRMLFQYEIENDDEDEDKDEDEDEDDDELTPQYKFADVIKNPKMQKTVMAILNACMNPDWPFVPTEKTDRENVELAWSRIQDKPIQYHFHYRLLDGDQNSTPPKKDEKVMNEKFNHLEPSCLQLIIDSKHSDVVISHPVVRVLVERKWDLYARDRIWIWFFFYLLFVACLGLALFLDDTNTPRTYETTIEKARGVFEVVTVALTFFYFIEEIDQLLKEKIDYFKDGFNILDCLGIFLIFAMIPLRFTDQVKAENGVGAAVFLINCLRVFKFFPAFETLGLYSKTFLEILRVDIFTFVQLFLVIMVGFTGCMFLALKTATFPDRNTSFWTILLKEARGLAEGNPFDDDYDTYSVVIIIMIVLNMGAIIVVLSNILIAQLSSRYEAAQGEAKIKFSIDKAKYITKIEKSRSRTMNLRMKNYIEGDYVTNESYITELLTDFAKLTEKRSKDSREAIKDLYSTISRQKYKKN